MLVGVIVGLTSHGAMLRLGFEDSIFEDKDQDSKVQTFKRFLEPGHVSPFLLYFLIFFSPYCLHPEMALLRPD